MKCLVLKKGSRSVNLRLEDIKGNSAVLTVDELWEDRDDEGYCANEYENATYYLTVDEIDSMVLKLREIKSKIIENSNKKRYEFRNQGKSN